MLVSTKGRYALRLMTDIATNCAEGPVSLKEIAERQDVSMKYLEQLVRPLASSNLLVSIRGQHGGYTLARPAEEISAGDILRSAEGDVAPVHCLEENAEACPRANTCTTLNFWQGLDKTISSYIDGYSLQDLIDQRCTL